VPTVIDGLASGAAVRGALVEAARALLAVLRGRAVCQAEGSGGESDGEEEVARGAR
jgi:hypothetical protein